VLKDASYPVLEVAAGGIVSREAPALNALNERLRDDFIQDSIAGVDAWNKAIGKCGIDFRLKVPHKAFNRQIGALAGCRVSPEGKPVTDAEWQAGSPLWLPTAEDRAFVQSLMGRVVEPGKFANWIAPPSSGINGQPVDFEYVRFN
jgi:benzoyl-CoA 2,3-dioxygenase component B